MLDYKNKLLISGKVVGFSRMNNRYKIGIYVRYPKEEIFTLRYNGDMSDIKRGDFVDAECFLFVNRIYSNNDNRYYNDIDITTIKITKQEIDYGYHR